MTLPQLYKQTKTGATQTCIIFISNDTYTVSFGQLDGAMQEKTTTCTPKNIGKANETTGAEQAALEAQAKYDQKVKKGYSTDKEAPITVQLPMKVKVYQDQKKNITFPCTAQPKLDGVNAMVTLQDDNSIIITSRGGELYPNIPHLEPRLQLMLTACSTTRLAGELYIHGHHLQDITSAVKKPNELSKSLVFNIFDLPEVSGTYLKRMSVLKEMCFEFTDVKPIPSVTVNSHADIDNAYNQAIVDGYEGIVIYNNNGLYEYNVRSSNVFKYKKAQDAEFQIVDCEKDKNNHPVFHCVTAAGSVFKVKPKGTDTERKAILVNFESTYLHKWYKVEFECYSKDNIPLKPVGLGLRSCDAAGNPIE